MRRNMEPLKGGTNLFSNPVPDRKYFFNEFTGSQVHWPSLLPAMFIQLPKEGVFYIHEPISAS